MNTCLMVRSVVGLVLVSGISASVSGCRISTEELPNKISVRGEVALDSAAWRETRQLELDEDRVTVGLDLPSEMANLQVNVSFPIVLIFTNGETENEMVNRKFTFDREGNYSITVDKLNLTSSAWSDKRTIKTNEIDTDKVRFTDELGNQLEGVVEENSKTELKITLKIPAKAVQERLNSKVKKVEDKYYADKIKKIEDQIAEIKNVQGLATVARDVCINVEGDLYPRENRYCRTGRVRADEIRGSVVDYKVLNAAVVLSDKIFAVTSADSLTFTTWWKSVDRAEAVKPAIFMQLVSAAEDFVRYGNASAEQKATFVKGALRDLLLAHVTEFLVPTYAAQKFVNEDAPASGDPANQTVTYLSLNEESLRADAQIQMSELLLQIKTDKPKKKTNR